MSNKLPVSATIVAKNERCWVKYAIESIVDLVDEIIFIDDKSTDKTSQIVKELSLKFPSIHYYLNTKDNNSPDHLGELKNYALSKASNDWILRWDADFIAYNDSQRSIRDLIQKSINQNKIDVFCCIAPNLHGDINHFLKDKEKWGHEAILWRKGAIKYVANDRYSDLPVVVDNNEILKLDEHYFLHMNQLKPLNKLIFRSQMTNYWLDSTKPKEVDSYWKWIEYKRSGRIINDGEEQKILEAAIKWKVNQPVEICDFDFKRWGPHPEIIMNAPELELFKLKEKEGKYYLDFPLE